MSKSLREQKRLKSDGTQVKISQPGSSWTTPAEVTTLANNSSNSREVGEQSRTVNNSSRTEPLDSSIRVLPSSSSRTQEGTASSRTVESSSIKTLLATRRPTLASRKGIKVQLVTKATSSSKNRGQRRQRSRETEVGYLTCDLNFAFDISF